jgi:hypothetical protein
VCHTLLQNRPLQGLMMLVLYCETIGRVYALLGGTQMVSTFFAAVDSLRDLPFSNHAYLFGFQGMPVRLPQSFQMVFFNYLIR